MVPAPGFALLEAFIEHASPEAMAELNELDIHNLRNVHHDMSAALYRRNMPGNCSRVLTTEERARCLARLNRARAVVDLFYKADVLEPVAKHKACFRKLLTLCGRQRDISRAAFDIAWPNNTIGDGQKYVVRVFPGWVATVVKAGGTYVAVSSFVDTALHTAYVSLWKANPLMLPYYMHQSTPPPAYATPELGAAIAELFSVKHIATDARWDTDPMSVYLQSNASSNGGHGG